MKRNVIVIVLFLSLISWQCSRMISEPSLKQSVEEGVSKINTALTAISTTKGYELMSVTGDVPKSEVAEAETEYADSITLDLVSGIYSFQPRTFYCSHYREPRWLFNKVGESDSMIVNIPQRMVFHPWKYLHFTTMADTALRNDFVIAASDYHFYYTWWKRYDYKLTAGFALEDEDIGSIDVTATGDSYIDHSYSMVYNFTDDLSVLVSKEKGDTMTSSFALIEGDDTLLREESVLIWKDFHEREKTYTLTIGDVQIVKSTGVDSIQVYLESVLQKEAAAIITDDSEETHSICRRRDIQLTFDDGTTVKLSELLQPALTTLKTLVPAMHSMYFAKHVVDHIALTIYYHSHN